MHVSSKAHNMHAALLSEKDTRGLKCKKKKVFSGILLGKYLSRY